MNVNKKYILICLYNKQFALLTSMHVISINYPVTETEKPNRFLERERFYRAVGMKMKAARSKKGFTQEAIAASVGLSRTSLTNIERGRQKLLLHTFVDIASALESTIADLLPDRSLILHEFNKQLPASLTPGQRDFIARAIVPSTAHEPTKTTENTPESRPTPSSKQNRKSSSRR